jgi:2,3-dihydroxybenzoate decarboxylase
MLKKIALEEHCMTPGMEGYWLPSVATLPEEGRRRLATALQDFHDARIALMDSAGVDRAILSLAGPGVQREPDARVAADRARRSNDQLAAQVQRLPRRLAGFAHLAMHDALGAADELERCVKQLGFKGALINGQTDGVYLDNRCYDVFWERAQALDVPIYLHPADPHATYGTIADYPELLRATWGWTIETASHALRLVCGGVFDRFPRAKLILGHMGETLPFLLWRLDSRYQLYRRERPLEHLPSYYLKRNVWFTTSGQCSAEALQCTIAAVGAERVMFSIDYPFESTDIAARFIESCPLGDEVRQRVAYGNASALFGLAG